MKILSRESTKNFVAIPEEVLLSPKARDNIRAMMALYELYAYRGLEFRTMQEYAESAGHNYQTWRRYLPFWEQSGFIRRDGGDIELYPFED